MSDFPLLVLGVGGHGRVVASALLQAGRRIIGFVDPDQSLWGTQWLGLPVIGNDECLADFSPDSVRLVNGIGSTVAPRLRRSIFEAQKSRGYAFETVIHSQAWVSPYAELGEGVQIMAGAMVQVGVRIGSNTIINTGAIVDHDCMIGSHTHVAPGAALSGGVTIGGTCHIGTGSVMIQGVELGENSVVGAGAVVIRSHASNSLLAGVPAKMMRKK